MALSIICPLLSYTLHSSDCKPTKELVLCCQQRAWVDYKVVGVELCWTFCTEYVHL